MFYKISLWLVSLHPVNEKQYTSKSSFIATSSTENTTCMVCKSKYNLYQCLKFTQRPVKQRFKFARSNKLCMNCLSSLHKTSDYKSTHTCQHFSLKHYSFYTSNSKHRHFLPVIIMPKNRLPKVPLHLHRRV